MLCRLAGAMTDAQHLVYSVSGNGVMAEPLRAAGAIILNDDQRGTARNLASLRRHVARQAPDIVQGWMYHGNAVSIPSLLMSPKSKLFWNIRQSLTDMKHVKASTRFIIRSQALLSHVPSGIIYNAMSAALDHEKIGFSKSGASSYRMALIAANSSRTTRPEQESAPSWDWIRTGPSSVSLHDTIRGRTMRASFGWPPICSNVIQT